MPTPLDDLGAAEPSRVRRPRPRCDDHHVNDMGHRRGRRAGALATIQRRIREQWPDVQRHLRRDLHSPLARSPKRRRTHAEVRGDAELRGVSVARLSRRLPSPHAFEVPGRVRQGRERR